MKSQINTDSPLIPLFMGLLGLIGAFIWDMITTEKPTSQIVLSVVGKAALGYLVFEGFNAVRVDMLSYRKALDST